MGHILADRGAVSATAVAVSVSIAVVAVRLTELVVAVVVVATTLLVTTVAVVVAAVSSLCAVQRDEPGCGTTGSGLVPSQEITCVPKSTLVASGGNENPHSGHDRIAGKMG